MGISITDLTSEIEQLLRPVEGVLGIYPNQKGVYILFNPEQTGADNIIELVIKAGYGKNLLYY